MSLKVKRLTVGQLQTNCYLLYHPESHQSYIIDPGDDGQYIIQIIQELELQPKCIIATHGHFDHLMAVTELRESLKIPFFIHHQDEFLVERMAETAQHFIHIYPGPSPEIDGYLAATGSDHNDQSDNTLSRFKLAGETLQIIHTPGHSPGGVSLYAPTSNLIFTGDTIFAGGSIGRYDFSYCNLTHLQTSVKSILDLPSETTIYPGHGSPTTVQTEADLHL